ncbi:MAG: hypothetical protein HW421_3949 [Ignavibacteria bacterium]|nr:hypothetical protein [Ignavibacteria bacterium]
MNIKNLVLSLIVLSFLISCSKDNTTNPANNFESVTIGTQVWMSKNLDVSTYRNGEAIPHVTDQTAWGNLTTGAWCYYNNDANNGTTYGKLYNWYAVNDPRGLAPAGWHVPSDAEWTTLTTYLGGESVAGGKLKETGTAHWNSPNTGATNESGFSALPGGWRSNYGAFFYVGNYGYWWSATESDGTNAWLRDLGFDSADIYRDGYSKGDGFSVRCLRD